MWSCDFYINFKNRTYLLTLIHPLPDNVMKYKWTTTFSRDVVPSANDANIGEIVVLGQLKDYTNR